MQASELSLVIDKQREEWTLPSGVSREKMHSIPLQAGFATIVTGIRRCGKSTLLRQWQAECEKTSLMLNFDDLRMCDFSQNDFRVLDYVIESRKAEILLFDEMQSIPHWELYIRQKLESGYTCLLTGSNASMLSRELGTKLTGRHLDMELFPFSYNEFLDFTHQERNAGSFHSYLHQGGLPSFLASRNPEIIRLLLNDIIYRDIAARYGLSDVNMLRSLCLYLLANPANLVNPSRLLQTFKVRSATTMLEYFSYLEQSYIIQRMTKFAASQRARLLAPKKLYIADSALHGAGRIAPVNDMGYLLENAVYNYLRQRCRELHYFASDSGECDFVALDAEGKRMACQVCWELTDNCREREFKGLLDAMKYFGLKEGTIVTAAQSDFAVEGSLDIHIVPAYDFCR